MKREKKTIHCSEAELRISERIDGEAVSAEEEARLDEHLAVCACCSEVLRGETERSRVIAAALAGPLERSERLVGAVLAQAEQYPRGEAQIVRHPFRLLAPLAGLAAAALVAVFLGGIFMPDGRNVVRGPEPLTAPIDLEVRRSVTHPEILPAADGRPLRHSTTRQKGVRSITVAPLKKGQPGARIELEIEGWHDQYREGEWSYR